MTNTTGTDRPNVTRGVPAARREKWTLGLLGPIVVVALAGSGCAPPTPRAPESTACPASVSSEGSGSVVIMLDRSASGEDAGLRRERVAEAMLAVDWAFERGAALTLGFFDGSSTTIEIDPCLTAAVMIPEGNNATTRRRHAETMRTAIEQRMIDGLAAGARTEGSDPMGAFRFAARAAAEVEGDRLVVISSDFVATRGCLALDRAPVGDREAIPAMIDACGAQGMIPDASGTSVVFSGVGRFVSSEPVPPESIEWMLVLFTSACEASGASHCEVTSLRLTSLGGTP